MNSGTDWDRGGAFVPLCTQIQSYIFDYDREFVERIVFNQIILIVLWGN